LETQLIRKQQSLRRAHSEAQARKRQRMGRGRLVLAFATTLAIGSFGAESEQRPAKAGSGLSYTNDVNPIGPWSAHVVRIERSRHEFKFTTTLGGIDRLGMSTLTDQLKHFPRELGQPLAAVNGDFYEKTRESAGRPRDIQIREGELLSHPAGHSSFWIDAHGLPHMTNVFSRFRVLWPDGAATPFNLNAPRSNHTAVLYTWAMGKSTQTRGGVEYVLERGNAAGPWLPLRPGLVYRAKVREVRTAGDSDVTAEVPVLSLSPETASGRPLLQPGAVITLITETVPDLSGAEVAIGGGPALLMEGKPMPTRDFLSMRHPRSAVGWNETHFFLVQVDGRQIDLSVGMTFPELAEYMLKLGCDYALNFDGGGSAALWALGAVRSSPSEGRERPSPNALVVVKRDKESQ
jgi:hypothetical protein